MINLVFNGELEEKIITKQFVENLVDMMTEDEKVVFLDADLMFAWGMEEPLQKFPKRMIKCGIAEANMVGAASGMSVMGMKPIIHSFAAFVTRRVFDQIFLSGAYAGTNLNIIGSEPGYTQSFNGGTHMSFEDTAIMRTIPNGTVFDIADGIQFNSLIRKTKDSTGIFYYRTPLKDNVAIYGKGSEFEIGKGIVLRDGNEATIIACGRLVSLSLEAAEILSKEGISVRVVDMFTIKPLDEELVVKCAKETGAIVTAENHSVYGGLGGAVAEVLSEQCPVVVERIGTKDEFGEVGAEDYLRKRYGFTPEKIAERVKAAIAKKVKL